MAAWINQGTLNNFSIFLSIFLVFDFFCWWPVLPSIIVPGRRAVVVIFLILYFIYGGVKENVYSHYNFVRFHNVCWLYILNPTRFQINGETLKDVTNKPKKWNVEILVIPLPFYTKKNPHRIRHSIFIYQFLLKRKILYTYIYIYNETSTIEFATMKYYTKLRNNKILFCVCVCFFFYIKLT